MASKGRCVVAGAGVIGLAISRNLAKRGMEVYLLEMNPAIGRETSARNSEVIHAGMYYREGSLKAEACVNGRRMLYDFCEEFNVPYRKCGKLIVASNESQHSKLDSIMKKSLINGLSTPEDRLEYLTSNEAMKMEPGVFCTKALLSPSTGIIDSHSYMEALLGEAEASGTILSINTKVTNVVRPTGTFTSRFVVETLDLESKEKYDIECDYFVNAIGLAAPYLAQKVLPGYIEDKRVKDLVPKAKFCKGSYFKFQKPSHLSDDLKRKFKFKSLIYPIPYENIAGLGVHLTIDLQEQARFGPDIEWIDGFHLPFDSEDEFKINYNKTVDYRVDLRRSEVFYEAIRKYLPDLPDHSLIAAYSGMRPKLDLPKGVEQDFIILGPRAHSVKGMVHMIGMESPGLTSSLYLADKVSEEILLN